MSRFRDMNDPACQWTVAINGRNLRCDLEAGHSKAIAHCNAETGYTWYTDRGASWKVPMIVNQNVSTYH